MIAAMPNLQRERAGFTERLGHYLAQPAPKKAFAIAVGKEAPSSPSICCWAIQSRPTARESPRIYRWRCTSSSCWPGSGRSTPRPAPPRCWPACSKTADDSGVWSPRVCEGLRALNKITYHYFPLDVEGKDPEGRHVEVTFRLALIAKHARLAAGVCLRARFCIAGIDASIPYYYHAGTADRPDAFRLSPPPRVGSTRCLLADGPGTGYAIARSAGLARANAYSALEGLGHQGGRPRQEDGQPKRFRPEPPQAVLARISTAQGQALEAIEPGTRSVRRSGVTRHRRGHFSRRAALQLLTHDIGRAERSVSLDRARRSLSPARTRSPSGGKRPALPWPCYCPGARCTCPSPGSRRFPEGSIGPAATAGGNHR